MSRIIAENLSIKFRAYHRTPDLKEWFASLFKWKHVAKYSDFWAVRDVSLDIKSGERVGIVGPNGAGKSTLMMALSRIYEPSSGSIRVDGQIAPLVGMGAGFQPEFTGRENIYLNGSILGYNSKLLRKIEAEVIEFAELEEFIDTPVKYYSSGMFMRLAFSIATAVHPDILILDEVFAGGDGAFITKSMARMYSLIDKANILIFVSHGLAQVAALCNRVVWMEHGQVKQDGPADKVLKAYELAITGGAPPPT